MLVDALLQAHRRVPNKLAVDDGLRKLTFRDLARLSFVFKELVAEVTTCSRVGIMLPASAVFPSTLMGVLWSGKTAVPLNFLLNADELAKIVEDAGLDAIFTIGHFRDLVERLPARPVYLENLPLKGKMVIARFRRLAGPPRSDAHSTAVILYTSGTTAEPKGVELTHGNLESNCRDTVHSLNIDAQKTFLNVLPPFHVFGLTATVLVPVTLGASVFALPRFSPSSVPRLVAEHQVSILMAVPSMYAAILRTKSAPADAFRSVYLAISGGEPLAEAVRAGFEERFGVTLREGYGLTETSPVVSACTATCYRPGSVGRPIRNVKVGIVAPDGRELPAGVDGEIVVSGPGVMKGYYKKPEETRRVVDADGRFHTGDIGHLSGDGFLSITGRLKEMLIIGGENVFPREIEAVLESHDAVLQAAVIGTRDDMRGESATAFVIPVDGASVSAQELRSHAKKSLAGFKVPKRIEIRQDLPQGPTGKILKRRLQDLL